MPAPNRDVVIPRTRPDHEPPRPAYAGRLAATALPPELRVGTIGTMALATYDPDGLLLVNTPHDLRTGRSLSELGSKPTQDRITNGRAAAERRRRGSCKRGGDKAEGHRANGVGHHAH